MSPTVSKKHIIMWVEPSKRLSALCGFPYFIERRFTVGELLKQKIITADDIKQMEKGNEIHKRLRVVG